MKAPDRAAATSKARAVATNVVRAAAMGLARVALIAAPLAGALPRPGTAQTPPETAPVPTRAAAVVGVISGGIDGTYARIAADLMTVLDDGERLRVLPVLGRGSVQNAADILGLRGVDVGIVQSDVLAYLRRERLLGGEERRLQYITKLYDEEVHLLARRGIAGIRDLAGQKVNVDWRGSGTAVTASVLFERLGIAVQTVHDDQATAVEKLKRGEIAALAYVTGKPARLFAELDAEAGLHLLPVPLSPALLEAYLPARLGHDDYPALLARGTEVDTVAVGAVLATLAAPPGSERHARVERFVAAFADRFARFLQPPRHPKWRDVNLAAQVPGWTRFPPAQALLAGAAPEAALQPAPPRPQGQAQDRQAQDRQAQDPTRRRAERPQPQPPPRAPPAPPRRSPAPDPDEWYDAPPRPGAAPGDLY